MSAKNKLNTREVLSIDSYTNHDEFISINK